MFGGENSRSNIDVVMGDWSLLVYIVFLCCLFGWGLYGMVYIFVLCLGLYCVLACI